MDLFEDLVQVRRHTAALVRPIINGSELARASRFFSDKLWITLTCYSKDVLMPDSLRRFFLLLTLAFGWIETLPTLGHAQEAADEDEPFLPGLIANYRDAQGHTATRLDFQLAFR